MRINNKCKAIVSLLKARFFNKRMPLAVRWQLTNRCIFKCGYCDIWKTPENELSLEEILRILDQLSTLGTQTISFSGGEPMLRKDIGIILEETKRRGISTEMNSTGATIPENISKLKWLDFLKISLDGPEEIQSPIRGKGACRIALEAADAAKNNNLHFIFTTTLTKYNINHIDFLLKVAKQYNTLIAFQPIKNLYRGIKDISPISPRQDEFKHSMDKLIEMKRKNPHHLRNSLLGLYHIYNWPAYPPLKCWAGKIFCIIDTDGTLLPCDRVSYSEKLPNCREIGFKEAFSRLPNIYCGGCGFCGPLELNYLMSFKYQTINDIKNILY